MRVLITGGAGQLGRDLAAVFADEEVRALSHTDLDVTDAEAVTATVEDVRPAAVIHAAALTDTARCEREPELAEAINGMGARNVARACGRAGAAMAYVSTNEVFDGKQAQPYLEADLPHPVNAYGRSKLAGERMVRDVLPQHYIVRTAWLYGRGGDHFVSKILRAAERGGLTGVVDEVATPTWSRDLARAVALLIESGRHGVYHLTNAGQASRYEWAEEALRLADKPGVPLQPVTTEEYRATLPPDVVAPRKPPYSVLRNAEGEALGIRLRPWHEALSEYMRGA